MNEAGKRERLRNGEFVELKPGVWGRLNKENRTLELDSGKVLPVGKNEQRDLFPENEQALDVARRTEKLEGQVKKAPFGEFLHQFGQSGVLSAPKDWLDYFTKTGDQYLNQKEAQRRVSGRISQESPITSGAATVASFVPDLMLTSGMSAAKAAPLLTAAGAGSRLVREPEEVAKEALISGAAGKFIDLGGKFLSNAASRRGASRALPAQQQAVREANQLGQQAVNEANVAQTAEFNALRQDIKRTNQDRLAKYQQELDARQNRMIEADNARKNSQFASAQEKKRLNEEFKLADRQYKEALKDMPRLQKEAQQEFSKQVVKNAERIENAFPKGSSISSIEIDVPGFFDVAVKNSGRVATNAEAQSKRILTSLFPTAENFTAKELASKYKAIEEAIFRAPPEVQTILNEFKNHLGDRIPGILAQNMTYNRVVPGLKKLIEKDIEFAFKKAQTVNPFTNRQELSSQAKKNIEGYFNKLSPSSLMEKVKNGELRQEIMDHLFDAGGQPGVVNIGGRQIATVTSHNPFKQEVQDIFRNRLDNALAKSEIKMIGVEADAAKRLGSSVKRTYGVAEPLPPPNKPSAPESMALPGSDAGLPPTPTPTMPQRPTLLSEPNAPTPQSFTPQAEPTLAPPNGLAERAGDFFEQGLGGMMKGNTIANNPIAKLAGLKYVLGKAALPIEAAGAAGYLGGKALTSPTALGQAARMTFSKGGLIAIDSWAQKYPSYRNGVLESPQDRRSLTKEIEDDLEIPIEQKAIVQSKINRGKPIQAKL